MDIKQEVLELVGDDGKASKILDLMKREQDRSVSVGIKTFQDKTLPGLVTAEVEKLTKEDPLKAKERELDRRLKAQELSVESGLPFEIVLRNIKGDESEDAAAIEELQELVNNAKIEKAISMQVSGAHKPQDSSYSPSYTVESLARIPRAERSRLYESGAFDAMLGRR
jgi:hypothetical protein